MQKTDLHHTPGASPLLNKWNIDELRYSFVWEDINLLLEAARNLKFQPKRMLSIGSAGDNAISLLSADPEEIVVIDLSPAQLALIELKRAALTSLSFTEFQLMFWGVPGENGRSLYLRCRSALTLGSQEYWDQNLIALSSGVHLYGRLDRYFKKFREQVLPLLWTQNDFEALVASANLPRQMEIWARGNRETLQAKVGEFFSRTALSNEGRHESQFAYVQQENVGPEFLNRFMTLISTQLIAENPYVSYFLTGQPAANSDFPLWNEVKFNLIRQRAERLTLVCKDLESYLASASAQSGKFDFINLSDLFEYLSEAQTAHLFEQLSDCMAQGARLAFWKLLVDRRPEIKDLLEVATRRADRTWFYSGFSIFEKSAYLRF